MDVQASLGGNLGDGGGPDQIVRELNRRAGPDGDPACGELTGCALGALPCSSR